MYSAIYLPTPPLVAFWFVSTFLATVNTAPMHSCAHVLFEHQFSILLRIDLEMELLGHMVTLC
jgi:hypothetical protein